MVFSDIDWENDWVVLLAFAMQAAYSIWLIVQAFQGMHSKMEFETIFFQYIIQYFYCWYFAQTGEFYSAIGIGVLTFAAVVAFSFASFHRRKDIRNYHKVRGKCNSGGAPQIIDDELNRKYHEMAEKDHHHHNKTTHVGDRSLDILAPL